MSDPLIETQLADVGDSLRRRPSARGAVMQRVTEAALKPSNALAGRVSRRTFTRFAVIAACVLVATVLWSTWSTGNGRSAHDAFAAAIANVEKARTFSARNIHRWVEDGHPRETVSVVMMREPSLERHERIAGYPAQVTITDYAARRQLYMSPADRMAELQDISTRYSVDNDTGRTRLTKLDTTEREQVLSITAQAVTDLGRQKLDGQDVRVLRSADAGEPVKTVWVKPESNVAVQIELAWPSRGATYTFASIKIDEPIADAMFSLDVPPGYTLRPQPEDNRPREIQALDGQMLTKARNIMTMCYRYLEKKGDFPETLSDLAGVAMNETALRALLAAPDDPNGPPVFVYRKVRPDEPNAEKIMVYEAEHFRRPGHVVAGFGDGHAEYMTEEYFNKLMK